MPDSKNEYGMGARRASKSHLWLRLIAAMFAAIMGLAVTMFSWAALQESSLNAGLAQDVMLMEHLSHERAVVGRLIERTADLPKDKAGEAGYEQSVRMEIARLERISDSIAEVDIEIAAAGGTTDVGDVIRLGRELMRETDAFLKLPLAARAERLDALHDKASRFDILSAQRSLELRSITVNRIGRLQTLRSEISQKMLVTVMLLCIFFFVPASSRIRTLIRKGEHDQERLQQANGELINTRNELEAKAEQLEQALDQASSQANLFQFASLRFQQLFGGIPVGCLTYDQEGNIQEWNNAMSALFEMEPYEVCYKSLYNVFSDPDQAAKIKVGICKVLADAEQCEFEWQQSFFGYPDKTFYCVSYPLRGQSGVVLGGILAVIDISSRKVAEEQIGIVNRELHETLESIKDCFFSIDNDWKFVYVNSAAASQLAKRPEDMIGQSIWDAEPRIKKTIFERNIRRAKRTGTQTTFEMMDKGRDRWYEFRVYPTVAGLSIFYQDISDRKLIQQRLEAQMREINEKNSMLQFQQGELERANQRLAAIAETDGLTGLKNHRAFQQNLAAAFADARRNKEPLSLILLDVDLFKQYNDSFGHPAGDQVLKQVASILRQATRSSDLVARYGGEEFAIILPGADDERVHEVAERIRTAIESAIWPKRQVTASLGCSTTTALLRHKQDLIDQADEALYVSKRNGRNCVTMWGSDLRQAA